MKTGSIRFRLAVWYGSLLTVVFLALAALLFLHLRSYLQGALGETQLRRARQIADTLVVGGGFGSEAALGTEITALYAPEKSDRFIRVTGPGGREIYRSGIPNSQAFDPAAVPASSSDLPEESVRRQTLPGGGDLLVAAVRVGPSRNASYVVEVGTSAAPVDALFRHVLVVLAFGLPLLVAMSCAGSYVLIGRALRPVVDMAGAAERITQHNLGERLPVAATGDELESLSLALNHMICRLDTAFDNSKRFVADASHELRTPLTILSGELEELAQDQGVTAEQRDRIGSLLEEVQRLVKIVERLFALSHLDAGEAQAAWEKVDLGELVGDTAEQMALLAEDRHIGTSCETQEGVVVEGDRARLKQVVVNLLDNAIKYTPEKGAVSIRVRAEGGLAVFEVADTGIGISEDDLEHVFDRFFRADRTRSRYPDGAGLGLSIVKSICHAHKGGVEAESAPGRGSCFRVLLPLAPSHQQPSESDTDSRP